MTKKKIYGISSYDSNAMKSSNPFSGIYEADSSRTLDVSGGNPACNQGGVVICEKITERRVDMEKPQALDLYNNKITGDNSASLTCNSNATSTQPTVMESEYGVRRLTPTECARLQGFPPDWCNDVPHRDSAEYKLWGNGIALPSILPMMQNAVRIVKEYKNEHI